MDCCFNLIRFHQQCILWSPPLEIEPATTECRAKTLPMSYLPTSHTSDAKLTSHSKCMANWPDGSCSYIWTLTEDMVQHGPVAQWSSFSSAFCGHWFNLQWGRSWYTLLMRPNKFKTAVQWFRKLHAVLVRFSGHGNSFDNNTSTLITSTKHSVKFSDQNSANYFYEFIDLSSNFTFIPNNTLWKLQTEKVLIILL